MVQPFWLFCTSNCTLSTVCVTALLICNPAVGTLLPLPMPTAPLVLTVNAFVGEPLGAPRYETAPGASIAAVMLPAPRLLPEMVPVSCAADTAPLTPVADVALAA